MQVICRTQVLKAFSSDRGSGRGRPFQIPNPRRRFVCFLPLLSATKQSKQESGHVGNLSTVLTRLKVQNLKAATSLQHLSERALLYHMRDYDVNVV